uniref:Response regulatory domain-containing protein n=3 Tax=Nymphaea colorata TaxID=210225 RepID=A0A5K0Y8N7_9MAGN|nr:unnamed protein product [Nymphaea colorata]
MMQGNIWLDRRGLGESMNLVLRLQVEQSKPLFNEHALSEHLRSSILKGLKVLIVDGDGPNRAATRMMLEKLGCRVSAVASGLACLSVIGCNSDPWDPFQAVILDIQLPEVDGLEVARRVRKTNIMWPLIIALTLSADDGLEEKCLQAGMNGVIRKPILLDAMGDELIRIVQHGNPIV